MPDSKIDLSKVARGDRVKFENGLTRIVEYVKYDKGDGTYKITTALGNNWYFENGTSVGITRNIVEIIKTFEEEKTGNCYETLEAAEYHRRMEAKSWQIRQMSFEPDWSDWNQAKFSAVFDHEDGIISFSVTYKVQPSKTRFADLKTAYAAFDGVSKEDFLYMQSRGMI